MTYGFIPHYPCLAIGLLKTNRKKYLRRIVKIYIVIHIAIIVQFHHYDVKFNNLLPLDDCLLFILCYWLGTVCNCIYSNRLHHLQLTCQFILDHIRSTGWYYHSFYRKLCFIQCVKKRRAPSKILQYYILFEQ